MIYRFIYYLYFRPVNISQWGFFNKRRQCLNTLTAICVTLIIIGHHLWIITTPTFGRSILYKVFRPSQNVHDPMLDNYSGEIIEQPIKMNTTNGQGILAKHLPQCIIISARKGGTGALVKF